MSIAWSDITVSLDGLTNEDLFCDWRWLIDQSFQPVVLTAMGDLFLVDANHSVHWLDVASGNLSPVSESIDEFQELIGVEENATRWFMTEVVLTLKANEIALRPQQVYSLNVPAVLGGNYEFGNITPTDVRVHLSIHGQIHRQVKDLPPGTRISEVRFQ